MRKLNQPVANLATWASLVWAAVLPAGALGQPVQAESAASAPVAEAPGSWPAQVVGIDQVEALTRFQLQVRGIVAKGAVTGPTVARVHVDAQGRVQRAVLHSSCGNGDLDEAVLHGLRDMVFKPYLVAGTAVPVTVLAPVHVPKRLGRS